MGLVAEADNRRLKGKLTSTEKSVSIWKQRYEDINDKYQELRRKIQPYLDALEIASEKVRTFFRSILAPERDKQTNNRSFLTVKKRRGTEAKRE